MALGWALYGLWVVFLTIAGRAQVTTRNFPAALVGLAANVMLLLLLVPPLGLAGAGIALCGAYVVMLGFMHLLTRRQFAVEFEWRRLAQLALVMGGLAVAGDLLLPTHGAVGLLARALVVAAIGPALVAIGFVHAAELRQARALVARAAAAGGTCVSRPPVSVVMPFAGSAPAARRGAGRAGRACGPGPTTS